MNALQRLVLWALAWVERYRYVKFGIVGASGTVVNLVMLHIGHEYIFNAIEAGYKKPYLSLALAIGLATLNNFTWNRLWTWSDRVRTLEADEPQPVSLRVETAYRLHDRLWRACAAAAELDDLRIFVAAFDALGPLSRVLRNQRIDRVAFAVGRRRTHQRRSSRGDTREAVRIGDEDRRPRRRDHRIQFGPSVPRTERHPHLARRVRREQCRQMRRSVTGANAHATSGRGIQHLKRHGKRLHARAKVGVADREGGLTVPAGDGHRGGMRRGTMKESVDRSQQALR